MRKNQAGYVKQPYVFRKSGKRIETLFSQLCDQFIIRRNYTKTFDGYRIVKIKMTNNEFKTINNPRKLACYAGVAPFKNTSGTSIFTKSKVSNLADKSLKKLLHLGAMSAIRLNNGLAIYYKRKVKEGKNKMLVLNAARNKIIHLIFALIKNQSFYQNRLLMS